MGQIGLSCDDEEQGRQGDIEDEGADCRLCIFLEPRPVTCKVPDEDSKEEGEYFENTSTNMDDVEPVSAGACRHQRRR